MHSEAHWLFIQHVSTSMNIPSALGLFTCVNIYFIKINYEISSSHSGEYEAQNLLGCSAVFLIGC
jgi:hypothetical protein